jgi:hypothetical protein
VRVVLVLLLLVAIAAAVASILGASYGAAEMLVLGASALALAWSGRAALRRLGERTRLRLTARQLTVERLRGGRVLESHHVAVDDTTAVEIARQRTRAGGIAYGVVLRSGAQRIPLDDGADEAMNEPLARQAVVSRFVSGD